MGKFDYDVIYTTSETIDQLEKRLKATCQGAWGVSLLKNRRKEATRMVKVLFEQEDDINALCRPFG